jgi:glycosyltransferase involved in cell wall biosynthesis
VEKLVEYQPENKGLCKLRILLSAYACEPNQGSEPGMGWNWALEIARLGHEVHVLTRANNVDAIKRGLAEQDGLRLHIYGYDLPRWARWWKKGPRGVLLYYLLWQWGAYRRARKLHSDLRFDLAHHITFAVFRHPSFMGRLGIPFVFGPTGGGEYAPPGLLRNLPWRFRVVERLRRLANSAASVDPLVRSTFRQSMLVFYKTPETLEQIPAAFHQSCIRIQDVAVDKNGLAEIPAAGKKPRFLFAGRLLYWKGIHLALLAMAEVLRHVPDAELTVVGDGRDRAWLNDVARQLGIEQAVEWRGQLPRQELIGLYGSHMAFVFPSLHDSGGTAVMEALSQGLPVICLDIAGPGAILPANCGFKIVARERTEEQVVFALAEAMKQIARDSALRRELAANALTEAGKLTWESVVRHAYDEIERVLRRTAVSPEAAALR